jgi:uncharacterized membrane protein (UPF0127 family)
MHLVRAEVAADYASRGRGLMHRKSLAPNAGMLFIFESAALHCMWMKNTYIPLSVAFIDEKGEIVNIADMQPHSEQSHCAARPALYALEMSRGWFAERGIAWRNPYEVRLTARRSAGPPCSRASGSTASY